LAVVIIRAKESRGPANALEHADIASMSTVPVSLAQRTLAARPCRPADGSAASRASGTSGAIQDGVVWPSSPKCPGDASAVARRSGSAGRRRFDPGRPLSL